jgi:hypothetical protein
MGNKLEEFYAKATDIGGLKAKMMLAVITKISSKKAKEEPDSPENLKKFQDAMAELEKELTRLEEKTRRGQGRFTNPDGRAPEDT